MALFFPSENLFDGVLTRQLEQLKAHAGRGITQGDQELIKEVALFSLSSARPRWLYDRTGAES
jgi:hypothetical protein